MGNKVEYHKNIPIAYKVIENLYVTSISDVSKYKQTGEYIFNNFTHILTIDHNVPKIPEHVETLVIKKNYSDHIYDNEIEQLIEFVHSGRIKNKVIIVGYYGYIKPAIIIMYYLISIFGYTVDVAKSVIEYRMPHLYLPDDVIRYFMIYSKIYHKTKIEIFVVGNKKICNLTILDVLGIRIRNAYPEGKKLWIKDVMNIKKIIDGKKKCTQHELLEQNKKKFRIFFCS